MNLSTLRFPIKTKLTVATLIPLAVAIFFCFLAGIFILGAKVATQAQEKVRNDLSVAREAYLSELSRICDVVRFSAFIGSTVHGIDAANRQALAEVLAPVHANEHLDVMAAVDASGRVIYRANNPAVFGDDRRSDLFVARALKGEAVTGSTIVPASKLASEGAAVLGQAQGAETGNAGLFLMAAVPVRDPGGAVIGAVYGGVLLNGNHPLMERIRGAVYEGAKSNGKKIGRASAFQGGLRIATTPQPSGAPRNDAARLPDEVYKSVMLADSRWVGRALVGNEKFLQAYEPIRSPQGVPIGALCVGMKESDYSSPGTAGTALLVTCMVLACTLIGVAVSGYLGGRLAEPVRELAILARRLAAGERDVRSRIASRDEIGDLAGSFNEMSRALVEREDRIIELNRDLEKKVELRTAELEEKNRLLVQTREELLRVEKLAAIGELAAGVAHEINNPMAIIRGNTELLQLSLPESDPNREEVDTIFSQVKRVERIVSNLLKFARKERREQGSVRLNELLHEVVAQIGHQVPLKGIVFEERYACAVELVAGDGHQLRQVFTNLVLNAAQAMQEGGVLTVESAQGPQGEGFQVRISDTGAGILPENLSQIFNPFFTTKPNGTGLGLSVSYGIVKEHGGSIEVSSRSGGTTFCVTLPG